MSSSPYPDPPVDQATLDELREGFDDLRQRYRATHPTPKPKPTRTEQPVQESAMSTSRGVYGGQPLRERAAAKDRAMQIAAETAVSEVAVRMIEQDGESLAYQEVADGTGYAELSEEQRSQLLAPMTGATLEERKAWIRAELKRDPYSEFATGVAERALEHAGEAAVRINHEQDQRTREATEDFVDQHPGITRAAQHHYAPVIAAAVAQDIDPTSAIQHARAMGSPMEQSDLLDEISEAEASRLMSGQVEQVSYPQHEPTQEELAAMTVEEVDSIMGNEPANLRESRSTDPDPTEYSHLSEEEIEAEFAKGHGDLNHEKDPYAELSYGQRQRAMMGNG